MVVGATGRPRAPPPGAGHAPPVPARPARLSRPARAAPAPANFARLKKSPGTTCEEGGPRPDFLLQARPATHPTAPSAADPAATPLERLAELMDGKASALSAARPSSVQRAARRG